MGVDPSPPPLAVAHAWDCMHMYMHIYVCMYVYSIRMYIWKLRASSAKISSTWVISVFMSVWHTCIAVCMHEIACICTCMSMYVCTCIYIYVHMCMHTHIWIHVHTYIWHIYILLHINIITCTCMSMHVCTCRRCARKYGVATVRSHPIFSRASSLD